MEYELASELNPTSGAVDDELRSTRNQLRAKIAVAREGKTRLQTLVERTRDLPPPGLDLPANVRMPTTVMFRDASSRDVFLYIARYADLSLTFDPAFRESPVTIDLRNASLEDALNAVSGATRTFFRVTAPRTITVIPDTPAKRREYEEEVLQTFYLSNADLKEAMDLLRLVVDLRRIAPTTATNALTIKDTPGTDRRRGARPVGDRQGASRGHHRRRAAGSRPDQAARVRAADRVALARPASTARSP